VSTKARPVRIKEKNGAWRDIGSVVGDTFFAAERDPVKHLFRSGYDSIADAMAAGKASWCLDLAVMEDLATNRGVRFVEVPTRRARYRVHLSDLLGPKSFVVEYGGHRPQVGLALHHWTETPR
jgi:hypothetical protein